MVVNEKEMEMEEEEEKEVGVGEGERESHGNCCNTVLIVEMFLRGFRAIFR